MKEELNIILKKLLKCAYVIIGLLVAIVLILLVSNVKITTNNNTTSASEEGEDYTAYDVSMFKTVKFDELVDLFDSKETQVVYVGRATCGYCVKFLPNLQQAQKEFGYKTNYYDIGELSSADLEGNVKDLAKFDNEEKFIELNLGSTPMVLLVRDGKLVDGWVGYAEYDQFASFLTENGFKK